MTNKVRVSFESVRPIKDTEVGDIPTIRAGVIKSNYEGYVVAYLYQHVGTRVSLDGIAPGMWFAIPTSIKTAIGVRIMKMRPPGGTLEYIKSNIKSIVEEQHNTKHTNQC